MLDYLSNRYFRVKQGEEYSDLKPVKAGVPQGSVLGPVLYLIFTSDIPQPTGTTVATFADDTGILAVGANVEAATKNYNKRLTQQTTGLSNGSSNLILTRRNT